MLRKAVIGIIRRAARTSPLPIAASYKASIVTRQSLLKLQEVKKN